MKRVLAWVAIVALILTGAWALATIFEISAKQRESRETREIMAEQLTILANDRDALVEAVAEVNRRCSRANACEPIDIPEPSEPLEGPPGERGPQGERGFPGIDGEDGRRGRSGRDGVDGRPGLDGAPGTDGRDGTDGEDGRDGRDGDPGPKGDTGDRGPKGDDGDRGPKGDAGEPAFPFTFRFTVPTIGNKTVTYICTIEDPSITVTCREAA